MPAINLASKYAKNVDERFTRESQAAMALNNDYEFEGVDTVKVYSIPIAPMNDYARTGANRYGTPNDLTRNVQTMQITKDRSFTFIIDKGDKIQSMMVSDAGKALSRQLEEVVVPEYDSYVFKTLAAAAIANGQYDATAATTANAYSLFLKANETLGDKNVPDQGRVAFCSYHFANLLKQDSAFMRYGDASQQMLIKGVIGEVDGTKIVKVPSSRLPAGAAMILTHPIAATGPKQLEDYKIHDNPPGISGWLVEGRFIYDCFTLNNKVCGIYYIGSQAVFKNLTVMTAATAAGKSTILVPAVLDDATNERYYMTAANAAGLDALTYGSAITISSGHFVKMTDVNSLEITPGSGDTVVRVVEVDGTAHKPVAFADAVLNIG